MVYTQTYPFNCRIEPPGLVDKTIVQTLLAKTNMMPGQTRTRSDIREHLNLLYTFCDLIHGE